MLISAFAGDGLPSRAGTEPYCLLQQTAYCVLLLDKAATCVRCKHGLRNQPCIIWQDCSSNRMGLFSGLIDWFRGLFFSRELEITLVGLQNAGKSD